TRLAAMAPSAALVALTVTLVPGFSTLASETTSAVIGTLGPTTSSDVPSLYLTLRTRPCAGATTTTSETAALVIIVLGAFIGRWPSPNPRRASGKMRSSVECNFPSAPLTAAEATKSPALIASRLDGRLATKSVPEDR